MKKKVLILLLSTMMVSSVFVGCSSKTGDTEAQSTEVAEEVKKIDIMSLTATDYIKEVNYQGIVDFSSISTASDDDVKKNIESYLGTNAIYKHVAEGTVANESIVNIDYTGTINDTEFDNGSAKGVNLDIDNNTYIDGFASGLVGHNVGDTVTLDLTFPDDYEGTFTDSDGATKNLAGQKVKFTVTINYICGDQITSFDEMTDEYASDLTGGYYKTLNDFIDGTRHDIVKQNVSNLELEMWDKLVKNISFVDGKENDVKGLVDDEYDYEMAYYTQMAKSYKTDLKSLAKDQLGYDDMDAFKDFLKKNAQYVVYQNLIVDYLAETNNLVLTDEQYQEKGAELATQYGYESLKDFTADYEEVEVKEYLEYEAVSDFLIKANGYTGE